LFTPGIIKILVRKDHPNRKGGFIQILNKFSYFYIHYELSGCICCRCD
jgi:hypothetical protein